MQLIWYGHASFRLKIANTIIAIDPYMDDSKIPVDVILISYWRFDHASRESIQKIRGENTIMFGTSEASGQIFGCNTIRPGEKHPAGNVEITAVSAYCFTRKNILEGSIIGFLIEGEGRAIYFTSDSEYIPEMLKIKADIMIVPVGGNTTMKPKEAAAAVNAIKPRIAIPMHYGFREGTIDDAETLKELVSPETKVIILEEGKEITL